MTKLYRETACEHDYMESHYTCDHVGYQEYNEISHTHQNCQCPGGSREEVTIDYEAAQERMDALLSYFDPDQRVGEIHIESDAIVVAALSDLRVREDV